MNDIELTFALLLSVIALICFGLGYMIGSSKGFIEGFHDYAKYIKDNYVLAYNLKEKKVEVEPS